MAQQTGQEITGIHKWPLFGALALVVFSLLLVFGSVISGVEPVGFNNSPTVTERSLLFRDGNNGEVLVFDADSFQALATFEKGEGAFVRISMRGMARQRINRELDLLSPFQLMKTENGNLYILDPLSDHKIRINAFGPVATKSFSQFLERDYSKKGAEG
ncbi:MAG: photosynthetic complex assembly protein PuhC [Pseudomonadota bacterium]